LRPRTANVRVPRSTYALGTRRRLRGSGLTPDRVHARPGGPIRAYRQDVRRGRGDCTPKAGGSSVVRRATPFNGVRVVLRRLGAEPRLHPHDRGSSAFLRCRHYLSAFWPGARSIPPGDVIGWPESSFAVLAWAEHPRDRRVGEGQLHPRDRPNLATPGDDHRRSGRVPRAQTRSLLVKPGAPWGRLPTYSHLIFALSLAMLAYNRKSEGLSRNMPRRRAIPGKGRSRRAVNYILIAGALACTPGIHGGWRCPAAARPRGHGGAIFVHVAGTRPQNQGRISERSSSWGSSRILGLSATVRHILRLLRREFLARHDPVHRDQTRG